MPTTLAAGIAIVAAAAIAASCRAELPRNNGPNGSNIVLRVGIGQVSVAQLTQLLSVEGLLRLGDDGRLHPLLAERWTTSRGGRSVLITLRPGVTFHDGSPADPESIVPLLQAALRNEFGADIDQVEYVRPADRNTIEIRFRRASPFLLEPLEVTIRKPGPPVVGTGPFEYVRDSPDTLTANSHYYLGPPQVGGIRIQTFQSVRSAWAELLRNRIDMLYEVGPDAIDSLEASKSIGLFTFTRPYQFTVAFNTQVAMLRPPTVRRALNLAVDRERLVRRALNGHAIASSGPIWPRYWALQANAPKVAYDPRKAAALLHGQKVRFTCLIPSDEIYERVALELKRQFADIDVDMDVRSATVQEIASAQKTRTFEAVLVDRIAGPTLWRLRQMWHSKGALNSSGIGSAVIDAAFDELGESESEQTYQAAVTGLEQAFLDDPPGIFLAWSERARAISTRFRVPAPEQARDVLTTIRLWAPRNDPALASRN